jgi:hypothetical protein
MRLEFIQRVMDDVFFLHTSLSSTDKESNAYFNSV